MIKKRVCQLELAMNLQFRHCMRFRFVGVVGLEEKALDRGTRGQRVCAGGIAGDVSKWVDGLNGDTKGRPIAKGSKAFPIDEIRAE